MHMFECLMENQVICIMTLNAKAEFFRKSKIMYNKAQCLRLVC